MRIQNGLESLMGNQSKPTFEPTAPMAPRTPQSVESLQLPGMEAERARLMGDAYGGDAPKRKLMHPKQFGLMLLGTAIAKFAGVKDADIAMGLNGVNQGTSQRLDTEHQNAVAEDTNRRRHALAQAGLVGDKIETATKEKQAKERRAQEVEDANLKRTQELADAEAQRKFTTDRDKALMDGKANSQEANDIRDARLATGKAMRAAIEKKGLSPEEAAEALTLISETEKGDLFGQKAQRLNELMGRTPIDVQMKKFTYGEMQKQAPLKMKELIGKVDGIIQKNKLTKAQADLVHARLLTVKPKDAAEKAEAAASAALGPTPANLKDLIRINTKAYEDIVTDELGNVRPVNTLTPEEQAQLQSLATEIRADEATLKELLRTGAKRGATRGKGGGNPGGGGGRPGKLPGDLPTGEIPPRPINDMFANPRNTGGAPSAGANVGGLGGVNSGAPFEGSKAATGGKAKAKGKATAPKESIEDYMKRRGAKIGG